ncbi:PAS domain-containing protein [Ferrovibrio sp.]|uniref:PAS domain-containing protein n=1 Tax=Ferrovibrio sp. TaxID=1917215 RepID=UPI001B76B00C|nr:PAS domain-containing protein [Ferrovibrio sp.]MBP7063074.1 PAS domain-containing protein [Ferrovibrio sp.]
MLGPFDVILEGQLAGTPALLAPRLRSNELSQLLRDWQEHVQRQGWAMPAPGDFTPENLRYLLDHILLFDVVRDATGLRFRYRHYGSHFSFARNFDLSGQFIDAHPNPHFATLAQRTLEHVCATGLPVLSATKMRQPDGAEYHVEALSLPLAPPGGAGVDTVLVGQFDHLLGSEQMPFRVNISDPALLRHWVEAPALRQLLEQWDQLCTTRGSLPVRADFPPENLRPWLGRVILLERRPSDPGLRYRLIGSGVTEERGYDITGQPVTDHPDAEYGRVIQWFGLAVLNLGRPGWYCGHGFTPYGTSLFVEGLCLPLQDDCVLAVQLPRKLENSVPPA